ncbi:MAG: signal peptidase I [Clostridia bacterium]
MSENKKKILKEVGEWIVAFVIAYFIYILINYYLGTISGVKQESMYPTAKEGQKVIIQRPTLFKKELKRGMILTCEAPLPYSKQDEDKIANYEEKTGLDAITYNVLGINKKTFIKRLIGLPGDKLKIDINGNVEINGEKYPEIYLNPNGGELNGNYMDLTVPEGSVFLMGDNRSRSKDCREFGCIPIDKINGYILGRIWPLNKIGKID